MLMSYRRKKVPKFPKAGDFTNSGEPFSPLPSSFFEKKSAKIYFTKRNQVNMYKIWQCRYWNILKVQSWCYGQRIQCQSYLILYVLLLHFLRVQNQKKIVQKDMLPKTVKETSSYCVSLNILTFSKCHIHVTLKEKSATYL